MNWEKYRYKCANEHSSNCESLSSYSDFRKKYAAKW